MNIKEFLHEFESVKCPCGKIHTAALKHLVIEEQALLKLPEILRDLGGTKAYLLSDANTFQAAGEQVSLILKQAGIAFTSYCFGEGPLKPNEEAVGRAIMHYDPSCDIVVGIGSGVINDIGKITAHVTSHPYVIVGTAPSMDGYASATSSMDQDGLKVSLPSTMPSAILADPVILASAPMRAIQSGMGDMIAKYISICEWRIAHEVVGEYYCERVAQLIRDAVKKCTDHAEGALARDPKAMAAIMEGLVIGGLAMKYAGVSRPASGMEHYFSHIWDMRSLEFGTGCDTHGNQCAIGTLLSLKIYEKIRSLQPDPVKAEKAFQAFHYEEWQKQLLDFIGTGARAMIANEAKEQKYSRAYHEKRLANILRKWDLLCQIMDEELPPSQKVLALLQKLGSPLSPASFGYTKEEIRRTFLMTKDIRDKYIGSMFLWDLGSLNEIFVEM